MKPRIKHLLVMVAILSAQENVWADTSDSSKSQSEITREILKDMGLSEKEARGTTSSFYENAYELASGSARIYLEGFQEGVAASLKRATDAERLRNVAWWTAGSALGIVVVSLATALIIGLSP